MALIVGNSQVCGGASRLGDNSNWCQIASKKPLVLTLSFDLDCAVKYTSLCLFTADDRFTLGGLDP